MLNKAPPSAASECINYKSAYYIVLKAILLHNVACVTGKVEDYGNNRRTEEFRVNAKTKKHVTTIATDVISERVRIQTWV